MSRARSDASLTPTKHRSGIVRAFSSFSKPVEAWGVSNVPVLSTSVTPRRERTLTNRSRQNSNSSRSAAFTLRRPSLAESFEPSSRTCTIRPLSIATISTFGGWLSERAGEDSATRENVTLKEVGTTDEKLSVSTCRHHVQLSLSMQHRDVVLESSSTSSVQTIHWGFDTAIHPLRMHPCSPPTSRSEAVKVTKDQNTRSVSRNSSESPFPSIPSFDDRAFEVSRESISTRRSRRELPELYIEATNPNLKSEQKRQCQDRLMAARSSEVSTDKYSSIPGDVGYVEAMRLWYEEKENEALETWTGEPKAARRAVTPGCALANANVNQRL